jgi:hydroxypyruvate reductase
MSAAAAARRPFPAWIEDQDAVAFPAKAGVTPVSLGDSSDGETRAGARVQAGLARQCARRDQREKPPGVLVAGGETTVPLRGAG